VEYLKAFVEEKGKRKVRLIGHSVDGAISMLIYCELSRKGIRSN